MRLANVDNIKSQRDAKVEDKVVEASSESISIN